MDEKEIKRLLRQAGDSLQAIFDYFRLKNKVLWTGNSWTTGKKTIKDLSKYNTIKVYPWDGYNGVLLERVSDTKFSGEDLVCKVSTTDSIHTSVGIELLINGDLAETSYRIYMHHTGGGGTHSHGALGIVKIVGIEPILPATLQNIIGGGYCIIRKGGVLHEVVHYLKAYWAGYKVHKDKFIGKGKQLLLYLWLRSCNQICNIYSMHPYSAEDGNISRTWDSQLKHKQCNRSNVSKTHIPRHYKGKWDCWAIWSCYNERRWRCACVALSRGKSGKCKNKFDKLRIPLSCMDGGGLFTGYPFSLAARGWVSWI